MFAVGISAGIGAVVSAIPALHPYTLPLCLLVLITLTFLNLRGIRESGQAFIFPVIIFHWVYDSRHCYRAVQRLAERRPSPASRGAS